MFTVPFTGDVQPGCKDHAPNDPSADIAIVRFNDEGVLASAGQLDAALSCITNARLHNPNGAVVILFVHGWHHSADWNVKTNQGDQHFREFRKIVVSLALREAERYMPNARGRRVVGIYFGWNGDPRKGLLSHLNDNLAFSNRYKVAGRIADGADIRLSLAKIIDQTKDPSIAASESPLMLLGHSMGAMILEKAFVALVREESQGLGLPRTGQRTSCADVESAGSPVKFPDVVVLLNSAADSRVAAELAGYIEQKRIQKVIACGPLPFQSPLIIAATSTGDAATRVLLPTVKPGLKTAANTLSMQTHRLVREEGGALCTPKQSGPVMVDFDQSWHCLRQPAIQNGVLTSIAIDLPQQSRPRDSCHVRYRFEPTHVGDRIGPYWIFQIPETIIKDHNDIFNPQSNLLIMGLMQVSGAVMSIAPQWATTFESEEGPCGIVADP